MTYLYHHSQSYQVGLSSSNSSGSCQFFTNGGVVPAAGIIFIQFVSHFRDVSTVNNNNASHFYIEIVDGSFNYVVIFSLPVDRLKY